MAEGSEWLRARGMGRERFAGYFVEFLESSGFTVERTDTTEPAETVVAARLSRMNPAVPEGAREVGVRLSPTSGGAAASWIRPTELPADQRERMDRFAREFVAHVERAVMTATHGTAKVTRAPNARYPWQA